MDRRTLFNKQLYISLRRVEAEYHDLICMEDNETIHDLRVAIRKATPLLDLYARGIHSKKDLKKIRSVRKAFKAYFSALSDIRDRQVMIDRLVELHPSSLAILGKMDKDIKTQHRNIHIQASEWAIPELIDKVMDTVLSSPSRRLGLRRNTEKLLRSRHKSIIGLLSTNISSSKQLHALRIILKKYRYTLEMAESLNIKTRMTSDSIKPFQDKLGYLQDITILLDHLQKDHSTAPILKELAALHEKTCQTLIEEVPGWKEYFDCL